MMENVIDITLDNFQQVIAEESKQKLVIVDFWASWCEPCKTLAPVLEKLASTYQQNVILAKVDCDQQEAISMQFGVRNLPTVILVKDGQPVDGFSGLQPEQVIVDMLEKHLPKPEQALLQQAAELHSQQAFGQAYPLAKKAYELAPNDAQIALLFADLSVELGKIAAAKAVLATIGLVDQNAQYHSVQSKIELAEQAADTPEIQTLTKALADDPTNMELRVNLSVQLQQANRSEEALALLVEVLQRDLHYGDAKKMALDIIAALPDGDAVASQYRRKIYGMMY